MTNGGTHGCLGVDFIKLDGKSIAAEGDFTDATTESFETVLGTFTATCP